MNRRRILKVGLSALAVACMGAVPALSETLEDKVVRALRRQGYRDIKTNRTFLGRLRVIAKKGERRREIILNRQTGEVLRDVIVGRSGSRSVFSSDDSDGAKSESSETGGYSGDDDSDDDRDSDGDSDSGSDSGSDGDSDSDGGDDD